MTYGPPCPFRTVGFTWKAGFYPLSRNGQIIIAEHNGVHVDQLPRGARNASGPGMHAWIETLGEAHDATGILPRFNGRWMTMKELAL